MNAIFTISANNCMALALTPCDSIRSTGSPADAFIFQADEPPKGVEFPSSSATIVSAKDIGIERFADMAFRYDVVEFSTGIKAFCIDYL